MANWTLAGSNPNPKRYSAADLGIALWQMGPYRGWERTCHENDGRRTTSNLDILPEDILRSIGDFLGERHIGSGWKCDEKMFFVAMIDHKDLMKHYAQGLSNAEVRASIRATTNHTARVWAYDNNFGCTECGAKRIKE